MAKKITSVRVIVLSILGVLLVVYLGYKIVTGVKSMQIADATDMPLSYTMPSEDSSIIRPQYLKKLKIDHIVNFKGREPISVYKYDDKYHLVITRIALARENTLNELLNFSELNVDKTVGKVYTLVDLNEYCKFEFQSEPQKPAASIFLTIY
jgi:hypothetical protein